jgi:hypothetical protein
VSLAHPDPAGAGPIVETLTPCYGATANVELSIRYCAVRLRILDSASSAVSSASGSVCK